MTPDEQQSTLRQLWEAVLTSLLTYFQDRARDGKPVRVQYLLAALTFLKWNGVRSERSVKSVGETLAKLHAELEKPFKA